MPLNAPALCDAMRMNFEEHRTVYIKEAVRGRSQGNKQTFEECLNSIQKNRRIYIVLLLITKKENIYVKMC